MNKNMNDIIKLLELIGFSFSEEYFNSKNEKIIYYTYNNINFIFQGVCTMMHEEDSNSFDFHYENDYDSTYKELCEIFKVELRKNKISKLINEN
jgi:hypothetical protein